MSTPHFGSNSNSETPGHAPEAGFSSFLAPSELADLWQSVAEDGGDLVMVMDAAGKFHYANRIFASFLERTPADIVGRRLHDFFPQDYADERLAIIAQALSTRRGVHFRCLFKGVSVEACFRPILPVGGGAPRLVVAIGRLASTLVSGFEDSDPIITENRDPGVLAALTEREVEVLRLIGEGLSTVEIAARLFRTPKTIEAHRAALGRKLGVTNRVQLARIAMQTNLVNASDLADGKPPVKSQRTPPAAHFDSGV